MEEETLNIFGDLQNMGFSGYFGRTKWLPLPIRILLLPILAFAFFGFSLAIAFLRNTALAFVFFLVSFIINYFPIYTKVSSFLNIFLSNFGDIVFLLAFAGLLMTLPFISKRFKKAVLKKVAENPAAKEFENYYFGFWMIFIMYLWLLDAVVLIISTAEFLIALIF